MRVTELEQLQEFLQLTDAETETETETDARLSLALDAAAGFICCYCRVREVPVALSAVKFLLAADLYRMQVDGRLPDGVQRLTEGKVQVSFGDEGMFSAAFGKRMEEFYRPQLDVFRKAGW